VPTVPGHRPGTMITVETLGSKQVYANPWMAVREDAIRRSDGSTGIYGVVDSPDIALIIPVDGDRLHLVEQYRYPVAGRRWEFPSGSADQRLDVDAAALAARELREETGLLASRLTPLGMLDVAPGMFNQRCRVFLATDLTHGAPQRELEEQDMRSAWFIRADVERMISDGTITDAKSIAAYTLLLLHGQTPHV
jgi:8-oxo-dGTP pyrophosphatase MutT (NUDIX family)